MADISTEIAAFQNAVYGEEVRGSMISLAEKLNDVTEDCEADVASFETSITAAIADAETAAASANSAASDATSAASSATSAASSATTAATSATTAASNANTLNTNITNAENARVTAENARATAERSRASAETARATAETARANSETNRASNEATRQQSESDRVTSENARISAEATRAAQENSRVSAETSRVSAETSRSTTFRQMQDAFAEMEQQILPPATTSTLGGVIVGTGIEVDNNGVISFSAGDYLTTEEAAATYATITTVNGKANASHTHSATDVTDGTLSATRGGTGVTTAAAERERLGLGSTTGALPIANGGTGATTAAGAISALFGTDPLTVPNGGTGADTLTANAILIGNGTSAVNQVTTASGAFYATTTNGAASFGTLPVAQGGTGATTADTARQALNASREWYATSSTAASTVVKTATCTGFVLEAGAAVNVRFSNENTAASATLNVNSTGAKAIYANGSTTAANVKWVAGETVHFVYDGTYWRMANSVAINSLRNSVSTSRTSLSKVSGITRGDLILTKVGDVVHVSGHFYSSSNIATGTALFETIPSELRPSYGYPIPCVLITSEGNVAGYTVTVSTSGTVTQGLSNLVRSGFIAGQYLL